MNGLYEMSALPFDVAAYTDEWMYLWEPSYSTSIGVSTWDLLLDLRNVVAPNSTLYVKPSLQFVSTRVDRPDDGVVVTTGSPASVAGLTKYAETPSGIGSKFFWRRGIGYRLAAGTFGRGQGLLYTSYRQLGITLPAEEVNFCPTNDNELWSVFPLNGGKPLPTRGIDKARLAVLGMGNVTATMEWQLHARFYNDPFARGDWSPFGTAATPAAGSIDVNTGDIPFTGVTVGATQFMDLGFGVRRSGGAASRCMFHVLPALTFV